MTKDDILFEKIKQFVYSTRWNYKQVLNRETRLYEDLKIDGDDAIDFFIAFEKEFKIDVSNFSLGSYFNGEGFDPVGISMVFRMLFRRKKTKTSKNNISITLGHLEKAVMAGRMDENLME